MVKVCVGNNKASAARAVNHLTAYTVSLLKQAFLEADLEVPTTPKQAAWAAKASVLNSRVCVVRTGTTNQGKEYFHPHPKTN